MKPQYHKLIQIAFFTYSFVTLAVITSNICLAQSSPNKLDRPLSQSSITDEIRLTVTVTNKRFGFVEGLTQQSFTIFDNKTPQQVSSFSVEDVPISVGILFDTSDSVRGRTDFIKKGFSTFIGASNKANEYFLVGFSDRPELHLNWTRDGSTILNNLVDPQRRTETALYDACRFGVEKVTQGTYPKRAIILISDGQDNKSRFRFKELHEMLSSSGVLVYAIGVFDINRSNDLSTVEGHGILDELSEVTGGMAFYPTTTDQAKAVFEQIAMELRHQYAIGFRPDATLKDVNWHPIKVKVNIPSNAPQDLRNLIVRTRAGYYTHVRTP